MYTPSIKTPFDLSDPSKMPGYSFSIPSSMCKTGAKLRKIPGSVCHRCYTFRGNYKWPSAKSAMERRFGGLRDKNWVPEMVNRIQLGAIPYFRWHDSGDIQGLWHLRNIAAVARCLPDFHFWLPTKEHKLVDRYRKMYGPEPSNLTIRMSAHMVDETVDRSVSSMVFKHVEPPVHAWVCPAKNQGNKCLTCRACWSKDVPLVAYPAK